MIFRLITLLAILSLLSACATSPYSKDQKLMILGSMISLKDGSRLELEVENYAYGKILTAKNDATGELLNGSYVIQQQGNASTGVVTNAYGFQTGKINTSTTKLALKGVLVGNKGTVINITIYLGNGLENFSVPGTWQGHAHYGEAIDNSGKQYQIQMSETAVARPNTAK